MWIILVRKRRRLRAAFDLMAGYLALLRVDARAVLDGRLSMVLSCLCEALEFDEAFNVQVGTLTEWSLKRESKHI